MLKAIVQTEMCLSPYEGLYDKIIPPEHILRRLKENIDFSFVNAMLRKQYCETWETGKRTGNDVQTAVFEEAV